MQPEPAVQEHGALAALRWALTRRPSRWPRSVTQDVLQHVPQRAADGTVAWVLVGHSTVLLQLGPLNLLFDPIWSDRCSPFGFAGPRRVRPPAVAFDALPPIDVVLVSHNHYDHCDQQTLQRLQQEHAPLFVTGRGVGPLLQGWGLARVEELSWWESTAYGAEDLDLHVTLRQPRAAPECTDEPNPLRTSGASFGVDIQYVPARHFSARGLLDRNQTLWGGFWIRSATPGRTPSGDPTEVYFCGDTGFDRELFNELRRRNGRPDLAFLPIGAYDPRWFMRPVHVNPEEAVEIHRCLSSRRSVGMHCATFQLTDEAIEEPELRLRAATRLLGSGEGQFTGPRFGVREELKR